ncbi:MAG: DNA-binding transcriptional regulator [FCB group bacterium]|jgi:putative transcriptional regulator|nr:DNA-binding transcriptional regulator [FCB group bacterium]
MRTAKEYKSPVLASVHETMEDLYEAGVVDKKAMREFDQSCLATVEPMKPEAIKALRLRAHVSQAVFARYLNVTVGLVSQWERGEKHPSGPALKLLTLVKKHGLNAMS